MFCVFRPTLILETRKMSLNFNIVVVIEMSKVFVPLNRKTTLCRTVLHGRNLLCIGRINQTHGVLFCAKRFVIINYRRHYVLGCARCLSVIPSVFFNDVDKKFKWSCSHQWRHNNNKIEHNANMQVNCWPRNRCGSIIQSYVMLNLR